MVDYCPDSPLRASARKTDGKSAFNENSEIQVLAWTFAYTSLFHPVTSSRLYARETSPRGLRTRGPTTSCRLFESSKEKAVRSEDGGGVSRRSGSKQSLMVRDAKWRWVRRLTQGMQANNESALKDWLPFKRKGCEDELYVPIPPNLTSKTKQKTCNANNDRSVTKTDEPRRGSLFNV